MKRNVWADPATAKARIEALECALSTRELEFKELCQHYDALKKAAKAVTDAYYTEIDVRAVEIAIKELAPLVDSED